MSLAGRARLQHERAAWLLAAPALLGMAVFILLPFAAAVALSLTDARLGSPLPLHLVGPVHYLRLLTDPGFLRALANTAGFAAAAVPLQTGLALALALAVNRETRASALARTLFFLPVVFPLSLVSVLWTLLYAPGGPMVRLLGVVTFGLWQPGNLLHDPWLALPAVLVTSVWQGAGFQMVILLAGLQSIPDDLYEAAALDGAGPWARFRSITLPMLRGRLVVVAIVTAILSFRLFDQVRIMTRGGPDGATATVVWEAVRAAFDQAQLARGSAMSVVLVVAVLATTLLIGRLRGEEA